MVTSTCAARSMICMSRVREPMWSFPTLGASPRVATVLIGLIAAAGLGGCFPYLETVRPDLHGHVVDDHDAPVAGAVVTACYHRWGNSRKCEVRASTVTNDAGQFDLPQDKQWDWCCLGEAPRWRTRLRACTPTSEARTPEYDPIEGAGDDDIVLQLTAAPSSAIDCRPE